VESIEGYNEALPDKPKQQTQKSWFTFTLNNYTEEEYAKLTDPDEFVNGDKDSDTILNYIIIGKEVGEKCGTPHLQCTLHTRKKIRESALIKVLQKYMNKRLAKIRSAGGITHNRKVAICQGSYAKKDPALASPGHPEGRAPPGKCDCTICYCAKDGDFQELGKRPFQGNRTDCEIIVDHIKQGHSLREILEDPPAALSQRQFPNSCQCATGSPG
jgi:hypothetical protein